MFIGKVLTYFLVLIVLTFSFQSYAEPVGDGDNSNQRIELDFTGAVGTQRIPVLNYLKKNAKKLGIIITREAIARGFTGPAFFTIEMPNEINKVAKLMVDIAKIAPNIRFYHEGVSTRDAFTYRSTQLSSTEITKETKRAVTALLESGITTLEFNGLQTIRVMSTESTEYVKEVFARMTTEGFVVLPTDQTTTPVRPFRPVRPLPSTNLRPSPNMNHRIIVVFKEGADMHKELMKIQTRYPELGAPYIEDQSRIAIYDTKLHPVKLERAVRNLNRWIAIESVEAGSSTETPAMRTSIIAKDPNYFNSDANERFVTIIVSKVSKSKVEALKSYFAQVNIDVLNENEVTRSTDFTIEVTGRVSLLSQILLDISKIAPGADFKDRYIPGDVSTIKTMAFEQKSYGTDFKPAFEMLLRWGIVPSFIRQTSTNFIVYADVQLGRVNQNLLTEAMASVGYNAEISSDQGVRRYPAPIYFGNTSSSRAAVGAGSCARFFGG